MNPLLRRAVIEFRARQPEQEEGRSTAGKVASVVAPVAVVGGVYKYWANNARRKEAQKARSAEAAQAETIIRNRVKQADYVGTLNAPAKPAKQAYAGGGKFDYGMTYEDTLRQRQAPARTAYTGGGKFDYGVKSARKAKIAAAVAPKTKAQEISQAVMQRAKAKAKSANVVRVGAKGFLARVTPIQFNSRDTRDGRFHESADPLTVYRKASRVVPWAKRAGHVAADTADIASGRKPKDPFYKKSWFKNAALATAIGAPILAARGTRRANRIAAGRVDPADVTWIDRKVNQRLAKTKVGQKLATALPFSAKPNKVLALHAAHRRLVEFAGLLPFRGYKIPAVIRNPDLDAGRGAYIDPKTIKSRGLTHDDFAQIYGKRTADRAVAGGAISLPPPMASSPGAEALGKLAYKNKAGLDRTTLRHEIVHSLKQQRRGGPPKGVIPLLAEEIAAYRSAPKKVAKTPGVKAALLRGAHKASGVAQSTRYGLKSYGIKPWKLFARITPRAVHFSLDPREKGWDLRDARGRSARVYAPGSRRRERREKEWGERVENIRAIRNVAIAGAVAGGVGTALLASKAKGNARTLKAQYREKIRAKGGPRLTVKTNPNGTLQFRPA